MMKYLIPCFYAFMACMAFCVVYNLKDPYIAFMSSLGGAIGWFVYLLSAGTGAVIMQNLFAAVAVAIFSELMARWFKTPVTVFLIIGILPLVPGGGIYYTMEYCIKGNTAMFLEKGLNTFAIAGAIAVGVSLVASIVRIINAYKYHDKRVD
ncbi:MAG: threonine/serine exporter family protein [Oscillospiraceae bacterium]